MENIKINDIDWSFEEIAAKAFEVPKERLYINKRVTDSVCWARYLCYMHLHKYSDLTLTEIGSRYGGRHHATILAGLEKYRDFMLSNKEFIKAAHYFDSNVVKDFQSSCEIEVTPDQIDQMKFMFEKNISIEDIVEFYGRKGISRKLIHKALGIAPVELLKKRYKEVDKYLANKVYERYLKKKSFVEVSKYYSLNKGTVQNIVRRIARQKQNK